MRPHFLIAITVVLWMGFAACMPGDSGEPTRRTQFIMGTLVEITVSHSDPQVILAVTTQAFDEMKRLEQLMSTYLPDSEISQINRAAGKEAVPVSLEVEEVIREGIFWSRQSGGAFDITVEPLVQLWDFDSENEVIPGRATLRKTASLVNYKDIEIFDHKVRLARPGMAINVNGLAKGYAVDRAVSILRSRVPNGIVNAGGDLFAFGQKSKESPWTIGLQHPRKPQDLLASFAVKNQAVATSGDYQRYFVKDGVRYHHIFDPATGMPARKMISTTLITTEVMEADAMATAVFVMGPEAGLAWVDSLDNVEAMVMLEDGSIRYSKHFRKQPQFTLK
ncbi:MAG: FAD:protein FMN transferase [Nitrospina sp.]|nr:MAG: FAD:protein FMN transferase [Nitrospina sp.]TDJ62719.1 MAG: FAD:protein FMN transferase [Nitrospina sp.]